MAAGGTERQAQRSILAMCGTCFPDVLIQHCPSGAFLGGGKAARARQIGALKGDGFKVGWPDLSFHWRENQTAFIEVKRPKGGVVSDKQKEMHGKLESLGFPVAVLTNPDDAFAFLKKCGAPVKIEWRGA